MGCETCPRRGSMSCAQAGIVQVRGAAVARPRVRVVGRGRVASAPSGEVRGGMGLVAASAPGKALPGRAAPARPAGCGSGSWVCAVTVPGCAVPPLCLGGPCGMGAPAVPVSAALGEGQCGGVALRRDHWAPVGYGLSRRPVG